MPNTPSSAERPDAARTRTIRPAAGPRAVPAAFRPAPGRRATWPRRADAQREALGLRAAGHGGIQLRVADRRLRAARLLGGLCRQELQHAAAADVPNLRGLGRTRRLA